MQPKILNKKNQAKKIKPSDFIPMIASQLLSHQELERQEEPHAITAESQNVLQYDQVMTTKLAISYAVGLEVIHRARAGSSTSGQRALDLACGPGHFTLCLEKHLGYESTTGVDLSPGMVEIAQKNALSNGLQDRCSFEMGDVSKLGKFNNDSFDLTTFADAAHHMPNLQVVSSILKEMDRVTKPDGLVMLMDLARLRTSKLTEKYVNTLGADYVSRGLPNFFSDFRDSMYAAWTVEEMQTAIPQDSRRVWVHLYPRLLPTMQFILGLPIGQKSPFLRRGAPWSQQNSPINNDLAREWGLARMTLFAGKKVVFKPIDSKQNGLGQRKEPRIPLSVMATTTENIITIVDASRNGLGAVSEKALRVSEIFELRFTSPKLQTRMLKVKVVWHQNKRYGLQIVESPQSWANDIMPQ
jgi:ubiquinone/menaquinone biosynthesis C-methylase UbiE